jgi:membrane-associated phospholipid phosphatase
MMFVNFIKSLVKAFNEAFKTNPELRQFAQKHPQLFLFFKKRLARGKFSGLPLTILSLAFLYVFLLFIGVISDVLTFDTIVFADQRISNLMMDLYNPVAVRFFLWVTLLGKGQIIILFGLLTSVILWLLKKRWHIFSLWLLVAGCFSFTSIGKVVFARARPTAAVYFEKSASFPSGHAAIAVAFYGFLIYLLLQYLPIKKKFKSAVLFWGGVIIVAIGLSRIYLNVHYFSDVWAGYLVGLLWLIIGISLIKWKYYQQLDEVKEAVARKNKVKIPILIIIGLITYFIYGCYYQPPLKQIGGQSVEYKVAADVLKIFQDYNLPKYTETITARPQEPISFIIIAQNDADFINHFNQTGWFLADRVSFKTTVKLAQNALANREYLTAPVTPSFWNSEVNNFGFEKSTEKQSVRQRHHVRFWKTNIKTTTGEEIYVGTASLDSGLKWLVTHRINPDIDTERDFLLQDLISSGLEANFQLVKLVAPTLGKNFGGDQFFTDGKAYLIEFK